MNGLWKWTVSTGCAALIAAALAGCQAAGAAAAVAAAGAAANTAANTANTAANTAATAASSSSWTFVGANAYVMQVQAPTKGSFSNIQALPLDPTVKATYNGKTMPPWNIPSGSTVSFTRDPQTLRVVRIDAH